MLLSLFIIAGFSEAVKIINKTCVQIWQFLNFQTLLLRRSMMRELTLNEMEEVSGGIPLIVLAVIFVGGCTYSESAN